MTSDLVIIAPEITPGSGGVADHTGALLRCWAGARKIRLLIANVNGRNSNEPGLEQLDPTAAGLRNQLPENRATIFVQYSAYGFNHFGYPRDLIRGLIDWKRRTGGRLVVMFHEIWTIWPFTNKNFILQQLHRRSLKRLLDACDATFTTTQSQADHLRRLSGACSVEVLPVGSNIPRHTAPATMRENHCAVVFGLQATRIRALEQMRKSLSALAGGGHINRIVCVGHGSNPEATRQERQLLEQLRLPGGYLQQGAASEQSISEILSSAGFGIFGQGELSCTKSGSFMAYAVHQLPVLAEFADTAKPPPTCWLVSPAQLLDGLERPEIDRRAECLRIWQETNASWEVIAAKIARALRIETAATNAEAGLTI